MKVYVNKSGEILTEKQFTEKYLNADNIKKYLTDGFFQDNFIKFFCSTLDAVITDRIIDKYTSAVRGLYTNGN